MLTDRIQQVTDRIARACASSGRDADSVMLLAVTKNHTRETVEEAMRAGLRCFGENRVQEAVAKYEGLTAKVELRLIGHLQSNKAKLIPHNFHWVESIDSLALAESLSRRLTEVDASCSVLLQFNSSQEESKSGFDDEGELLAAAAAAAELPGIELRGIMTIGPFTGETERIVRAFSRTRKLFERVRENLPSRRIDVLSMGMTDDLEVAIAEGSTEVRVGTAIFGARS